MFAAPHEVRRNWLYWLVLALAASDLALAVLSGALSASLAVLSGDAEARAAFAMAHRLGLSPAPPVAMALLRAALFAATAAAVAALALRRWIAAPIYWAVAAASVAVAALSGPSDVEGLGTLLGAAAQVGFVSLGMWLVLRAPRAAREAAR